MSPRCLHQSLYTHAFSLSCAVVVLRDMDAKLYNSIQASIQGYLAYEKLPHPGIKLRHSRSFGQWWFFVTWTQSYLRLLEASSVPYTLNPTPFTLHPTPYTLHPTPYTPHPKP